MLPAGAPNTRGAGLARAGGSSAAADAAAAAQRPARGEAGSPPAKRARIAPAAPAELPRDGVARRQSHLPNGGRAAGEAGRAAAAAAARQATKSPEVTAAALEAERATRMLENPPRAPRSRIQAADYVGKELLVPASLLLPDAGIEGGLCLCHPAVPKSQLLRSAAV
jgi:hypothetical protein